MKTIIAVITITLFSMTSFTQEKSDVTKEKVQHRKVYTEIIIDASPEQVWSVLMDFSSYSEWAVFFKGLTGEIKDQGKVIATFQKNEEKDKTQEVNHTIFYEEGKRFGWSEKALMGIKDNHQFIVEGTKEGKTRFIQSDELRKGATWLMGGYLSKLLGKKYPEFNRSLKVEVERRYNNN